VDHELHKLSLDKCQIDPGDFFYDLLQPMILLNAILAAET